MQGVLIVSLRPPKTPRAGGRKEFQWDVSVQETKNQDAVSSTRLRGIYRRMAHV